uniref:histidine kinase n=1 Tax=Neobacillus citreus TaxID=2833578 RepID=A0A942YBH0_9BACI
MTAVAGWDAVVMTDETPTLRTNAWLHMFFAGTVLLVTVVTVFGWSPWATRWPAFVALTVFVGTYAAYGWRGYEDPRAARAFLPIALAVAFVLPAITPTAAFVQCIVFPLVWCQVRGVRLAVLLSVAVGVLSGLGLQFSGGPDALVGTLLIETVSVIGSCGMGIWMTRVANLAEERRQLLHELREAQQSLADANRSAGVASERERLAREIHDTVAQHLAGIVMLTERARTDLANDRVDALEERLVLLEESSRAALEDSRALIAAGAVGLSRDSLGGALHRLAERHTRETGTPVSVDATDFPLDRDAQVVLLRVVQEALANVRAHADAASVHVALRHSPERVGVLVTDDGVGFDPSVPSAGHGLPGLRERLALSGGTCTITSSPGHGTVVDASLPTGPDVAAPTSIPVTQSADAGVPR